MFNIDEETNNNPFCEPSSCEDKEKITETEQPAEESATTLQDELDDLNNKYLRLLADFDNYRKRQAQERDNMMKCGTSDTLRKIITALDTFERAKKSVEEISEPKVIKESYEIAIKQLYDALEKCGLEKIETDNKEFDPTLHEAVAQTPTAELPEHTIVSTAQTGYKMGDIVLRPALVNVSVAICETMPPDDSEE